MSLNELKAADKAVSEILSCAQQLATREFVLSFQFQFQAGLVSFPSELFDLREQLGDLLALEVQLAVEHVPILALFAGCRDER